MYKNIRQIPGKLSDFVYITMAQTVEHGNNNAKGMSSIPREWASLIKPIPWMQCKSLCIKASVKCIILNVHISLNL